MSHWDFGRRPDAEHDAPLQPGSGDTACEPDLMAGADDAAAEHQPDGTRADEGDWPSGDRPAGSPWPAETGWPADELWPAGTPWPADELSPTCSMWDEDAWDDGEGMARYPITYEREDFLTADPQPSPRLAPPPAVPWEPWPPAPYAGTPGPAETPGHPKISRPREAAPDGQDAGPRAADAAGDSFGPKRPGGWRVGFAGLGHPSIAPPGAGWPAPDPGWPAPEPDPDPDPGWPAPDPGWPAPEPDPDPGWPASDPDPDPGWPGPEPDVPGEPAGWNRGSWSSARHTGTRRQLVLAGIAAAGAAVGAAVTLLANGFPAARSGPVAGPSALPARTSASPSRSSASAAAPLTLTQAKGVVTRYTTVNNAANARRSNALLATIETGSSYAIDAGLYQSQQGTAPYPPFGPAQATYYIPRDEPASGPRWFVVQVGNAFSANPSQVTSSEYLLFTQSAPGGPWLNAVEPYLLPGASAPRIAVGADGLATAVSPDAASAVVAPGQLPAATAASLDGTAAVAVRPAIAAPGNLADLNDKQFWQGKLPGDTVTDAHAPATGTAGQEFALRTADGGMLVFYADAAQVTMGAPAGTALHLTVPGFYSSRQALSRAGLSYLEQFATYDPPAGSGRAPSVVADYSGITGKNQTG